MCVCVTESRCVSVGVVAAVAIQRNLSPPPASSLGSTQAIAGKLLVSLLAPSAFSFSADLVASYEESGQGIQWGHLWCGAVALFPCAVLAVSGSPDTMSVSLLACVCCVWRR